MRWNLALSFVIACATLVGCRGQIGQEETAASIDVEAVRAAIQKVNPGTLVGVVSEVLPDERLAAVRDVPVDQFRAGMILSLIDTGQNLLTHAKVVRIVNDSLHVMYDAPPPGTRVPRTGDLAVRFQ
jgi:hypothetical protein